MAYEIRVPSRRVAQPDRIARLGAASDLTPARFNAIVQLYTGALAGNLTDAQGLYNWAYNRGPQYPHGNEPVGTTATALTYWQQFQSADPALAAQASGTSVPTVATTTPVVTTPVATAPTVTTALPEITPTRTVSVPAVSSASTVTTPVATLPVATSPGLLSTAVPTAGTPPTNMYVTPAAATGTGTNWTPVILLAGATALALAMLL